MGVWLWCCGCEYSQPPNSSRALFPVSVSLGTCASKGVGQRVTKQCIPRVEQSRIKSRIKPVNQRLPVNQGRDGWRREGGREGGSSWLAITITRQRECGESQNPLLHSYKSTWMCPRESKGTGQTNPRSSTSPTHIAPQTWPRAGAWYLRFD